MTSRTPSDPARTLLLLWGRQDVPGRSGLHLRAIVSAGIELADAEGLAAVSMRRVSDRLGVGAMSLYTHVPGKTELTELMSDAALQGLYSHVDEPADQGDWQAGLTLIARRNIDLWLAHPWLLDLPGYRPSVGPHLSDKYEAELRPLDGIGLTDLEMDATLTLVLTHAQGVARSLIQQRQDTTTSTDADWWSTVAPVLEQVMHAERFPVSGRVGAAAGQAFQAPSSPEHALGFGLGRILAGVTDLLRGRPTGVIG